MRALALIFLLLPQLLVAEHLTIDFGGRTREAWLDVGKKGIGPWPLVLVLHGGGGTADRMARFSGFSGLAVREGFAVCYPESISRHWNDGRVDFKSEAKDDDSGFIAALVTKLITEKVADPKAVYVCGISNGGMMTLRLACEHPELFAACGVIAGGQPSTHPCQSSAPMPIYFFHGSLDPLVPYAGGEVKLFKHGASRGRVDAFEATVADWQKRDHAPAPKSVALPSVDGDPTRATLRSYGQDLKVCLIEGGGHTWPGGSQYAPQWMIGKVSQSVQATPLLWQFFKAHRKP